MTETVHDTSPVVQSVEIDAPAERVFALWTEPEELVKWWPDAVTLEARVGGRMHLVFEGRGEVTGEITRFEPPHALGFTWVREVAPDVTTQVDVTIDDLGGGRSRVELVHSGFEKVPEDDVAEWRMMHDAGWRHFLAVLAELAEKGAADKTWRG